MFQPLSLFVGLRYIRHRQGRGFAKFISAASTLGIAVGVMVLIVVLSAMNGFEKVLADKLLSIVPHAELIAVNEPIPNWQNKLRKLEQQPHVIAAAPVTKLTGMLQHKSALKAVEIRGVDRDLELKVSNIADYVIQGQWLPELSSNTTGIESSATANKSLSKQIVIGAGIANKLGVSVGDTITALLPQTDNNHQVNKQINQQFKAPKRLSLTVGAIFRFGGMIDDSLAYIALPLAAELSGTPAESAQGIRVKVTEVFNARRIAKELAYNFDHYVYIYDWTYSQGHLFNDIQLVRTVMFIVMMLVIAVASFNIVSTLIMVVKDKQGDIAILKTMGASHRQIMTIFIMQGTTNGIVGALTGAALGCYLALNLTDIIVALEQLFGVHFLSGDVYFIDYLPSQLKLNDVYIITSVAFVMSIIATIYPAWQAAKIEPAQVLGQQ
ncbi:lipoprotein-releasing ABC transporter permease subunit LolE [Colwellia sp. MEBiC06753]